MATCPYIHDPDKVAICTKYAGFETEVYQGWTDAASAGDQEEVY